VIALKLMSSEIDIARVICKVAELFDPGSRGFTAGSGDWPLRGFITRRGTTIAAYVNRCPHAGHPLNFRADEFLTPDESMILCRSHGAVFELTTGYCVAGPCAGRTLQVIAVSVVDGYVMLTEDPDALAARFS
jgi:nitrite reductase/ring-hydroxylating ferredoxin subunit